MLPLVLPPELGIDVAESGVDSARSLREEQSHGWVVNAERSGHQPFGPEIQGLGSVLSNRG